VSFGGFVKKVRKKSGLDQQDFAKAVGVHTGTVSRWENGHAAPELKHLDAMLGLLKPPLKLSDCLYLPEEVSKYRRIETAIDAALGGDEDPPRDRKRGAG
jgi:transcriptional regulator with XRE-family HTH domain